MSKDMELSAQDLFAALLEHTEMLVAGVNAEGRVILYNPACEKTTGYSREEIMGKHFSKTMISSRTVEQVDELFEKYRTHSSDSTVELPLLTKDGEERFISWTTVNIYDDEGRPEMAIGLGVDITERWRLQQELAASEVHFRLLIENASDLITVIGPDAVISYIGPSVERLLGYGPEELIGKDLLELIHADEVEVAKAALDFAMSRPGITGNVELRIRHKDGSWRMHEASSFNLLDNPRVRGLVINSRDITDRKAMEEELLQRGKEMEAIFQALPDLYFRLKKDGTIVDYRAGKTMDLYAPPERFLGKRVQDVLPSDVGLKAAQAVRKLEADSTSATFEYTLPLPGGEQSYEARMMHAFEDEVIVLVRNITQRKQSERLLRVQRDMAMRLGAAGELSQALQDSLQAVLAVTGMDCGGIYIFDEDSGSLNLVYHEGLSESFVAETRHYDADSDNARMVASGEPLFIEHAEFGLPRADPSGQEGLRAAAMVPIKSERKVVGSINVGSHLFDEIPERSRHAMEVLSGQIGQSFLRARLVSALRESEEIYRVTFESTGTAMIIIGLDGTILDGNQEVQRLLGYSGEEVIGKRKYMEFVHPDDLYIAKKYAIELLRGRLTGPVRYEARTIRGDGRVIDTLIHVSMLPGMNKSVASLIDITEKKEYERELEARAEQLRDFLDVAAHELRHPATLVKGFAATLEKYGTEMSQDDIQVSLNAIERGSDQLTNVVDDLLDISRIERGPLAISRTLEDLRSLAFRAVEEIMIRGGGNRVEVDFAEDLDAVWVDADKFLRLMIILLDNAVKYSPAGSPIRVLGEAADGEVFVSVMDRGEGVPDKERGMIFERFYQAETTLHHSGPGLGLGLYIAKRIVEAHGGEIWYESREGGGSSFRFTLPIRTP
jgi:PAS domain S-box-containing protein